MDDKIQEIRYRREDVSGFPPVLTRVEVEAHGKKVPYRFLSEIHCLLEYDPFEDVEVIESHENDDFRNSPQHLSLLYLFNKLSDERGASEAARIMKTHRNFALAFSRKPISG